MSIASKVRSWRRAKASIRWVSEALVALEPEFGQEAIQRAVERFRAADEAVYKKTLEEHEQRVKDLVKLAPG